MVLALALAIGGTLAALYFAPGLGTQPISTPASLPSSSPPAGTVSVGTLPGQRAPDFTVTTTRGEAFRLSSHSGQVVVLSFLAPGCPSCAAEVPALTKAWEALRDKGVVVLVIDVSGGPVEDAVAYYHSVGGGDYLYAADKGFRVAKEYGVLALGTTVIVDPAGIVSYLDSGPTPPDTLEREIGKALA